jgi:hypothetical protein
MPNVTAGLAQLSIEYSFNNTAAVNVFHYWNQTNTAILDLQAIITAFDTKLMVEFADLLTLTTTIDQIVARDVFGLLLDQTATPTPAVGTRTGELNGNFTCCKIRLDGTTKETKVGWKRVGGISEFDTAGNGLSTGFLTVVQTFAALLNDSLTVGVETYIPVIFGRGTLADPTRRVVNTITGTFVPNQQTTQNSRKR